MFGHLYKASSAHQLFEEAKRLVINRDAEEQKILLNNPEFVAIVGSSLRGMDQCKVEHFTEFVSAFDSSNQGEARRAFVPFLV